MFKELLNKAPSPDEFIAGKIDLLAAEYATDTDLGTAAAKISALTRSIVAKCCFCDTATTLAALVNCADADCPLYHWGPPVFEMVLMEIGWQRQSKTQ
jgi:hypothetical protein